MSRLNDAKRVLLVEGSGDREVIYQFCNRYSIDNRALFEVKDKEGYKEGYDHVLADLKVRPKSGAEIVGAVIDADDNPGDRWRAIRAGLIDTYPEFPEVPQQGGTIIDAKPGGLARVGVWLMPNNNIAGMLEDFLAFLVPDGDALWQRARDAVAGIPERERKFRSTYTRKAEIHTWLAWQEEPGTALGLAITRRYLDTDHPLAKSFRKWMVDLFPAPKIAPE